MDAWLAQIYGTNGGGEDLEKTAQYMLLEKLAAEEGVDLSGLSPEQIDELAQNVTGQAGAAQQAQAAGQPGAQAGAAPQGPQVVPPQPMAPQGMPQVQAGQPQVQPPMDAAPQGQPGMEGQPQPGMDGQQEQITPELLQQAQQILEMHAAQQAQMQQGQQAQGEQLQKEAQAKFEEADFLGRVMAHAYHQELTKIATMGAGDIAGGLASRAGDAVSAGAGKVRGALESMGGHMKARMAEGSSSPMHHVGDAARFVGRHPGASAGVAGGLAAAGLGAAAMHHHNKEKTAGEVAVEALAQARAIEMLKEAGYTVK